MCTHIVYAIRVHTDFSLFMTPKKICGSQTELG